MGLLSLNSPFNNPNLYGLSKIAGEFICQNSENFGILRFGSLFGPGMNSNLFISRAIRQIKSTSKLILFGTGARKQNYLPVSKAAELCRALGRHSGNEIFLGVSEYSHTNLEVANILVDLIPGARVESMGEDDSPSWEFAGVKTAERLAVNLNIDLKSELRELIAHV